MQEAYVNINSIPTHIFTWGRWIEETITEKEIVICITGNPGLPGFYTEFAGTLQKELGDLPVWVIGKRPCLSPSWPLLLLAHLFPLQDTLATMIRQRPAFERFRSSAATRSSSIWTDNKLVYYSL